MSELFTPIQIRHVSFKNRIVLPPMVREHGDEDGCVNDSVLAYYRERAAAGAGLIIVEATAVEPAGRTWPGGLCAYSERHGDGLARLAEQIHRAGAVAMIQLVHGGPKASSRVSGVDTVAPSAVRPSGSRPMPRALSIGEIHDIGERFADAAALAVRSGFDGAEIHGAHGYLLDSFLMRKYNTRTDTYGGSMANSVRALAETCERVRVRLGSRPLLGCRVSLFNKLHEGFSLADTGVLIRGLEAAGVDLLHLSTLAVFGGYFGTDRTLGQWAKGMTDLPLIVAGRLRQPLEAERAIADGHADFAAVGTAMLQDADWAQRAARELLGEGD